MAHLDVLCLLQGDAGRAWTTGEVASRLRLEPVRARDAVLDLVRHRIVAGADDGFRFAPADASVAADADAIVSLYMHNPVTLIRAIYERPSGAQSFADAFRLRDKEDSSG